MKSIKATFVFLFCIFTIATRAQDLTLSGKVIDESGQGIDGVAVHVLNLTVGTTTDATGSFALQLAAGRHTIVARAVGYATRQLNVDLSSDQEISITLKESIRELPDLVVTAEKEETNLRSVPYSVSSLEGEKLEQYRVWNLREISNIIPNLYSADPGDNRNVTGIRGVATTSYDPAVATYIDGVNQFSLDTYIAPLFDVERIEVLRGPQSTLYGRNAMGGVINVITRAPGNTTSGFAEAAIGSFGTQRYTLGVRTPIIKDKLFIGAAGMFESTDGYYTNEFDNSDFDKRHSTTGNYYLTYQPSRQLSVSLNVKHHANRNDGAFSLAFGDEALEEPYKITQNAVARLIDNTVNTSLRINHTSRAINVTSLTSYQSNHRYYDAPLDADFSPIDGMTIFNDYGSDWNKVKVFTEEIRVSSNTSLDKRVHWTLGTYLFLQDNPVKQATRFGEDAAWIGNDDTNSSIINTTDGQNKGIAFFGQATLKITDRLLFTGGLRYDYEKRKQSVLSQYQSDPNPNPIFDIQPDTSATASFNAFSPKASLQYLINDNANVYASYSRGFRTGGLTQLSMNPSEAPLHVFDPEFSNNIEIGTKLLLAQNRVQLNAAAFLVQVIDAQVPTLVLPEAIVVTRNTGELKSYGVEAEVSVALLKGLSLDYNLGLTKAEYKTLSLPQEDGVVDLEGNKQIFTPDITSRLAVQYVYKPVASPLQFFARGEVARTGTVYFDLANQIKQSPYTMLNARAGVGYKRFELSAWGRNLSDETVIAYAYDFGGIHLAEPRNYGVALRATF